jgi:hypothetical protein
VSTPHHLRLRGGPAAGTTTPQQVLFELPGSQVPLAPPPEMHAAVSCVVAPVAVAHPDVPTDQWADGRCSCGQ